MNRALILSSLVAAFMLVACDKPGAGTAPGASPSSTGTSSMGAPPSPASAASN